jgi:hypothetical protein
MLPSHLFGYNIKFLRTAELNHLQGPKLLSAYAVYSLVTGILILLGYLIWRENARGFALAFILYFPMLVLAISEGDYSFKWFWSLGLYCILTIVALMMAYPKDEKPI